MDKKGVAGVDFMKALAIGVFVLVVLFFAFAIAGSNLQTASRETMNGNVINESGWINHSGYVVSNASYTGFSHFSVSEIRNATNQAVISPTNYTYSSGGNITNTTAYTFDDVDIDYSFRYTRPSQANSIMTNYTSSLAGMGTNVSTWLVLGALVVLISIIVVIILVVQRVQGGKGGL